MTEFFSSPKVKLSTTRLLDYYNNKNTQVRVIFLSKRLVLLSSAGADCVYVTFIYLYLLRVRRTILFAVWTSETIIFHMHTPPVKCSVG